MLVRIAPLYIDQEVENRRIPWNQRFARWLQRYIPLQIYIALPFGRRSLEAQLNGRSSFPTEEWERQGFAVLHVKPLLEVIATELQLPNANLLPDDPLHIVIIPGYDDFTLAWLHRGLEHRMRVVIDIEELRALVSDSTSTVKSLVDHLIRKLTLPGNC